jgi:hypothetical protein
LFHIGFLTRRVVFIPKEEKKIRKMGTSIYLARSKSLLNYNRIADMVWISQDLKALIFTEA